MGFGLVIKDKVSEKFLLLFIETQADDKFLEALFCKIPLSFHHEHHKIARLETSLFGKQAKGIGVPTFLGLEIPVPQKLPVVLVFEDIDL